MTNKNHISPPKLNKFLLERKKIGFQSYIHVTVAHTKV